MFEPSDSPRLFALPPGVDFPVALIAGLEARLEGAAPEEWARVELFVNTRRMKRRILDAFDAGPARLLPRVRLVTELAETFALDAVPPAEPPLRRRLELARLIAALLEREPDIAPRSSLFDLADSLANLMDEMHYEGVPPSRLAELDVDDSSGYWRRSLAFLNLIQPYFEAESAPSREARQRRVAEHVAALWKKEPPRHPVIVAGSSGSRGATSLFMQAVARAPQGALVLSGFDFDMPSPIWDDLKDAMHAEDHPQFRFARLLNALECSPDSVRPWHPAPPPSPPRNRLISLALRPAPVTDQWMTEGKRLENLEPATVGMTLVEAPSQRLEAGAIALILREAAENGIKAALITPDRTLARQVSASLDRWGIEPDDSAGRPLPQSPPGRFLRHVAALFVTRLTAEALVALLKHPIAHSGSDRVSHLFHVRDLEMRIRRQGPAFPTPEDIRGWARGKKEDRIAWADWLADRIDGLETRGTEPLERHVARHLALAEELASGSAAEGSGALWDGAAGLEALKRTEELREEAHHGGEFAAIDYASLFHAVLQRGVVRQTSASHPNIMIWGTLEARVQGAELAILGGLNEGSWPEFAQPDPWLNRKLRNDAGLLLPERRIGLAAHDFQQAAAAERVVLCRSIRDAEAQTVPSRWLNRLTNLMSGASPESEAALAAMRERGDKWLGMAEALDAPTRTVPPANRPSPRPPVGLRPKALSVTEIQRLIRDPYAIYARHVLGLSPLDPLRKLPDAPLRGTVLHRVFELAMKNGLPEDSAEAREMLVGTADRVLAEDAPWPAMRRIWLARIARVADWFVANEALRAERFRPSAFEMQASLEFPDLEMTLRGKIDRIDMSPDGRIAIVDYKTGRPPTAKQQEHFDKQLLLEAMMAEAGAVEDLPATEVQEVVYIGLGVSPATEIIALEPGQVAQVREEFESLIAAYRNPDRGYTSRRAMEKVAYGGDFDQLARFGEWDATAIPEPIVVGR